jgi:hypothetical protein
MTALRTMDLDHDAITRLWGAVTLPEPAPSMAPSP